MHDPTPITTPKNHFTVLQVDNIEDPDNESLISCDHPSPPPTNTSPVHIPTTLQPPLPSVTDTDSIFGDCPSPITEAFNLPHTPNYTEGPLLNFHSPNPKPYLPIYVQDTPTFNNHMQLYHNIGSPPPDPLTDPDLLVITGTSAPPKPYKGPHNKITMIHVNGCPLIDEPLLLPYLWKGLDDEGFIHHLTQCHLALNITHWPKWTKTKFCPTQQKATFTFNITDDHNNTIAKMLLYHISDIAFYGTHIKPTPVLIVTDRISDQS
ncbi:hypothetical protein WOLCODRAFT_149547 [Wolfiporia cocos MD-104 SS10]|uniref:Uncharacterized protein n=1 Tax=Wolfiporia cocos (strain MD-104) TaxID=742152 RepID=A0A2H3J8Q7_WOLCO|nr:hypothetical protein WOLCODRAFT_149547 [Wolfiporia cocos MD-104 SS10]